jgi:hypothetical protein
MDKDIVIVPSAWRPEFLEMCLEHLAACPELSDKQIWIVQDFKTGQEKFQEELNETFSVVEKWRSIFGKRLTAILRPSNNFYGGSYSVLSALNRAYKTTAKYVFEVEDDILVSPDFFKFHERVQNAGDYFCSIAGTFEKDSEGKPFPLEWKTNYNAYFKNPACRTLGMCFKRENLGKVLEHYKPEYYTSDQTMVDYMYANFRDSKYGIECVEYDGLISRVMEQDGRPAACSCAQRARHIGIWGYHRGIGLPNMIQGTLEYRIEQYKKLLNDPEWLKKVAWFQTDVLDVPAPIEEVQEVYCINE